MPVQKFNLKAPPGRRQIEEGYVEGGLFSFFRLHNGISYRSQTATHFRPTRKYRLFVLGSVYFRDLSVHYTYIALDSQ